MAYRTNSRVLIEADVVEDTGRGTVVVTLPWGTEVTSDLEILISAAYVHRLPPAEPVWSSVTNNTLPKINLDYYPHNKEKR